MSPISLLLPCTHTLMPQPSIYLHHGHTTANHSPRHDEQADCHACSQSLLSSYSKVFIYRPYANERCELAAEGSAEQPYRSLNGFELHAKRPNGWQTSAGRSSRCGEERCLPWGSWYAYRSPKHFQLSNTSLTLLLPTSRLRRRLRSLHRPQSRSPPSPLHRRRRASQRSTRPSGRRR